jgi:hypothetical protein
MYPRAKFVAVDSSTPKLINRSSNGARKNWKSAEKKYANEQGNPAIAPFLNADDKLYFEHSTYVLTISTSAVPIVIPPNTEAVGITSFKAMSIVFTTYFDVWQSDVQLVP